MTAEASVKQADAVEEVLDRVVTKPMLAHLIRLAAIALAIFTIRTYIEIVCDVFSLYGPGWEAYAGSAVALPCGFFTLYMVSIAMNACIVMYAMGPPPENTGLTSKIPVGPEVV